MQITDVQEHFLFPNTIFFSKTPTVVQTILGSCVAVCLFDQVLGYGAINHYMLPWWSGNDLPSPKYGDIAVIRLIESLNHLGSKRENMVAKLFGGSDQLTLGSIGQQNIVTAEQILHRESINIIARSTGGAIGRKIIYHTGTSKVLVKFLGSN
jgi:chemotaxis protein CheD